MLVYHKCDKVKKNWLGMLKFSPLEVFLSLSLSLSLCLGVSDDVEDECTGISEGGWRKEKPNSKTQLNRDLEKESGEAISALHWAVCTLVYRVRQVSSSID